MYVGWKGCRPNDAILHAAAVSPESRWSCPSITAICATPSTTIPYFVKVNLCPVHQSSIFCSVSGRSERGWWKPSSRKEELVFTPNDWNESESISARTQNWIEAGLCRLHSLIASSCCMRSRWHRSSTMVSNTLWLYGSTHQKWWNALPNAKYSAPCQGSFLPSPVPPVRSTIEVFPAPVWLKRPGTIFFVEP